MEKSLLNQWRDKINDTSMPQKDMELFWNKFCEDEKKCYQKLLNIQKHPILGTVESFAKMFDVDLITFIGFLEGLNDCLKNPNSMDDLTTQTIIILDYNAELLYKKMKESDFDVSIWDNSIYNKSNINKMDIVYKILSSNDKKTFYYYIHTQDFSSAKSIINKYCNCNDEDFHSILNLYVEEYSKDPEIIKANAVAQELLNKPHCPICNSTNLSKITTTHKVVKIAAFGIFGMGDNGKTWKCNNCGSRF